LDDSVSLSTSIRNRRGDIFGGITSAVVALPLALAFGVVSGAGALAGLYGAIFVGFFAAVFGGTRLQVSGPTGPMTVVMALIIAQTSGNLSLAFAAVILAGIFQIVFGVAGIGRYIKLVPQPVVSGFMTGIGVIIIILQLGPALGHPVPSGAILVKLAALPEMVAQPNYEALALCLGSLAVMIATPRRMALMIPPPLVAIVAGTILGAAFLTHAPVIGTIPTGVPTIDLPGIELSEVPLVVEFALILAFLGAIDSLLTSLVADSVTRTRHDSNRELIGQGLGNAVAGLFGGIAGAGATMRTLVNIRAGATTRMSGALHAVVLLLLVLGFGGAASAIPLAVLAGILLKVGYDIIDWQYIKRIHVMPRAGVVIMLTTLSITVFVDLMTAVAVGIVMASLLFVSRVANAQMETARVAFSPEHVDDPTEEEAAILKRAGGRIMVLHVEGPLSFGSARDIAHLMQASPQKDALVVDLTDVPFIDTSASMALEEAIEGLRAMGDTVIVFGMRPRVADTLRKTGVMRLLEPGQVAPNRLEALRAADAYTGGAAPLSARVVG
jgi:SulP family sulfate permease